MTTPNAPSDRDDAVTTFARARAAAVALGRSLTADQASAPVPACPGWTVTDVFAHVTGIVDDLMAGRTDGLGSDAWTAAQVGSRRGRSLDEVCDEYEALGDRFDAFTVANPEVGALGGLSLAQRLTADLTIHQGDLAAALGLEPDRSSPALFATLARYGPAFVDRVAEAGRAPVRLEVTGGAPLAYGPDGGGVLTVRAEPYELVRALAGRRSLGQILAFDWSGDASAHAPLFSSYGLPAVDGA